MTALTELRAAERLAVALLIGIAMGLEREWSGQARGPVARFAGLRTFTLLGMLGGIAGLLAANALTTLAAIAFAAGAALAIAAYVAATRTASTTLDGTTEAAAIVVLALGTMAGLGWLVLAAASGALVVWALSEKQRLHQMVRAIGETELHAALQFTVLAAVVLPLLPRGPFLGVLAIRPRALWGVVLGFSALNFASYIARRAVGPGRGYGIAGALGGLMSSTAVTLTYARRSVDGRDIAIPLARGVIAACTVLIPRVLVISAVLNPAVAVRALPYLLPAGIIGLLGVVRRGADPVATATADAPPERNPLRLLQALEMAIAFQVALSVIAYVRPIFGDVGVYGTAAALGLTDMDALTVSMSSRTSLIDPSVAARALGLGILVNTLFKLTVAAAVGRGEFRRRSVIGLGGVATATAVVLAVA